MNDYYFANTPRVDALAKVRGEAIFCADDARPDMMHAALAVATIGKGRITHLDTRAASAVAGVRSVLTHENIGLSKSPGFIMGGGYAFQSFHPLLSATIAYRGQPIALVAADTIEAAIEAAALVEATYDTEPFSVTLDAPGVEIVRQMDTPLKNFVEDIASGDADRAFNDAAVKIDSTYMSPPQHQNPMELIASVVEWRDGTLVVHEGTQNAGAIQHGLAMMLGLAPDRVEVIAPYAGGGFGQKNSLQMQTALAAVAARELGRPVKIVVPRAQIFHDASFRPASRHRVRLGADRSGRLLAAIHEVDAQTSRHDFFPAEYAATSSRLYGFESFRGEERLVRTDVQTPGYMRAPFEHSACFAMESSIDELAYALDIDPVTLRLANDTTVDPITKKPLSSRHLSECLRRGARRFGWDRRTMEPQSMRADDGSFVGWGVAAGTYPGMIVATIARLKVKDDGSVVLGIGGHEMGQGIRTALAAVVSRKLGVPVERVTTVVGDTRIEPQHVTAGSWGTSSTTSAAEAAIEELQKALAVLSPGDAAGRTPEQILRAAKRESLEVEVQHKGAGQPDAVWDRLRSGLPAIIGPVFPDHVTFSY
ncbi:MAG TPA: molybdopterin cofactor-binding domain-containing protein, partial [Gemmatimonadaceae bacterium]